MKYRNLVLIIVSILLFAGTVNAHQVSGRVTDQSGTGISGCSLDFRLTGTTTSVASTATVANGAYSVTVGAGTYDIVVSPPSGSGFQNTVTLGKTISTDTVVDFVLVPPGTSSLSGVVRDALGAPLPNQTVLAKAAGSPTWDFRTTTDVSGRYAFTLAAGPYDLYVDGQNYDSSLAAPRQHYRYTFDHSPVSVAGNTVMDVGMTAHRVHVIVEDPDGNRVPGAAVSTNSPANYQLTLGSAAAYGASSYNQWSTPPVTDPTGETVLWLFPGTYLLTVAPPFSSGFATTNFADVEVTGDRDLVLTLRNALRLSGRVLDAEGNGLPNQRVLIKANGAPSWAFDVTTDAGGNYLLGLAAGSYDLYVDGQNYDPNRAAPRQHYRYSFDNAPLTITADTVMDIPMPAHRMTVTVRDAYGNAVPNVGVSTNTPAGYSLTLGSVAAYGSSSYPKYSTPPVTDADGKVTMWLFPNTYLFTAAPPLDSEYAVTNFPNIVVNGPGSVDLTLSNAVVLSGRVLDAAGNGLPSQRVLIKPAGSQEWSMNLDTDAVGRYAFNVAPGSYDLYVDGQNYDATRAAPRTHYRYSFEDSPLTVAATMVMDIPMPAHPVNVLVQDPAGNPVPGVSITTDIPANYSLTLGLTRAYGASAYGYGSTPPQTDASGRTTLWLFPNTYLVTATPPGSLPFASISIHGVDVSGPKSLVVVLQFTHDAPLTTATVSPSPDAMGQYPDPATISLAASAATGYGVAATYYRVDHGAQQTYSSPFAVSGGGAHLVEYWSVDTSGVTELPRSLTFTIQSATIESLISRTQAYCGAGIAPQGLCNSLVAKLNAAAGALRRGQPSVARLNLEAYASELRAQKGKGVSIAAYDELSAIAAAVIARL